MVPREEGQVMTQNIFEQAQRALLRIVSEESLPSKEDLVIIKQALYQGAREADAWEEIELWMSAPKSNDAARELNLIRWGDSWEIELMPSPWDEVQARSRLAAIEEMAERCHTERTK